MKTINKLKSKPHLMRKLKIFAVVGLVGILITGALTIWAGIAAFNYVTSKTSAMISSPVAQMNVENLKKELSSLPKLKALGCWDKAQTLMAVQPWLDQTVMDNLLNLKLACLDHKPSVCEGKECESIQKLGTTDKGSGPTNL